MSNERDSSDDQTRHSPLESKTIPDGADPSPATVERSHQTAIPRRIGRYRIVRKLGEGGLGIVYEAEQAEPRRAVALKVIRGGRHVSDEEVRMFAREAQALARLRHPGIATIYEYGRTEDGQPFFAMELIRGATLLDFLKDRQDPATSSHELSLRLQLFRKICEAIAYAHQKGVIHRDLKPGNIMVSSVAAPRSDESAKTGEMTPEIKVLDFGMARITDVDADMSMVTQAGRVQGTVAYMSPEQARGNPDEIDARSDIYALGIIFYEMLTGARPYDAQKAALFEAVRVICEEAPRSFTDVTGRRSRLDKDLETIALKALEKDPGRRYQSVSGFAEDIGRYLTEQPILARSPSAAYQIRKMVRRHRFAFAMAVTTLCGILLLATVTSIQNVRISKERDRAERQAARAEAVVAYLGEVFGASTVLREREDPLTVEEVTERAAERIFELETGDPLLKADLLEVLGSVYARLGRSDQAEALVRESLELRTRERGETDPTVASSQFWLAWVEDDQSRYEEARRLLDAACPRLVDRFGGRSRAAMECAASLGASDFRRGNYEAALERFEEAQSIARALGNAPSALAMATTNVGGAHLELGRLERAERVLREAIDLGERADGKASLAAMKARNTLGDTLREQGRFEDALVVMREALELQRARRPDKDPNLVIPINNLAEVLRETGRLDEAALMYEEAQSLLEAVAPEHEYVGALLFNRGDIELRRGRPVQAELLLTRALDITENVLGEAHIDAAETRGRLADALREQERLAEAEALYLESRRTFEAQGVADKRLAAVLEGLARLREAQGNKREAADLRERAAAILASR